MSYKCPACSAPMKVTRVIFKAIPECEVCGQKVVVGSIVSYLAIGLCMIITALLTWYGLKSIGIEGSAAVFIIIPVVLVVAVIVFLSLTKAEPYDGNKRLKR